MMGAAILTNLPALLVVVPLLLAPFSAVLPIAGLAWVLALVGTGISFLAALMLQSCRVGGDDPAQFQCGCHRICVYIGSHNDWPQKCCG